MKRIPLLSGIIAALSFCLMGVIVSTDRDRDLNRIPVNGECVIDVAHSVPALNGLHRVEAVTAVARLDSGDTVELPTRSVNGDNWTGMIRATVHERDGQVVSTGIRRARPRIAVGPAGTVTLAGQRGLLRLTGAMVYPEVTDAENNEFGEAVSTFDVTVPIEFVADQSEAGQRTPPLFAPVTVLFLASAGTCLIASLGSKFVGS